ncbi:MAG: hypothetical protein ACK5WZ_03270 [Pseudobdellovibrionaceae bacterium]
MNKTLVLSLVVIFAIQNAQATTSLGFARNMSKPAQSDATAADESDLTDADLEEMKYNLSAEHNNELNPAIVHDAGYREGSQYVTSSFYIDPVVTRVFTHLERSLTHIPATLPPQFNSVKLPIRQYIENYRRSVFDSSPELHQLTFDQLAEKITRAAFCFKIDPKMVVAKLQQETKFDRTAFGPNGVGMSQLTTDGIEEVHDQLGGRPNQAPKVNVDFFNAAADCYLGVQNGLDRILWREKVPRNVSALSENNVNQIKKLISNNMDLDLIFGHIVLKVNLMQAVRNRATMSSIYSIGMMNYNGNNRTNRFGKVIKVEYAKSVLAIYERVSRATTVAPNISI